MRRAILAATLAAMPAAAGAAAMSQREADQYTFALLRGCDIEGSQLSLKADAHGDLHAEISPTLDDAHRRCAASVLSDMHLSVPELPPPATGD